MSIGQPRVLPGVGGSGHVEVVAGGKKDEVIVNQKGKIVLYNLEEKEVIHTWYTPNIKVNSAVKGLEIKPDIEVIVGTKDKVVFASTKSNKLSECEELKIGKELSEIKIYLDEHWLIFADGTVETLNFFLKKRNDEWGLGTRKTLLRNDEKIGQSKLSQVGAVTHLGMLVENASGELFFYKVQIVLETDTESRCLKLMKRHELGPKASFISIDMSDDLKVCALREGSYSLDLYDDDAQDWKDIISIPNSSHCGIKWLDNSGHVAVMGSLVEGGFLKLVDVSFKATLCEVKLKSTIHSKESEGSGAMNWVEDQLHLAISNKLISCQITNLEGGLSHMLGKLAPPDSDSPFNKVPELIEANQAQKLLSFIDQLTDLPENLLLECILYFLDSERSGLRPEAQQCYLGNLFGRAVSEVIMEEELVRLSLSEVISLVKILDSLLHDPAGSECNETDLINWLGLLLNTHYLKLAVARDEETRNIVKNVQETVQFLQGTTKSLNESKVLAYNIINTKLPTVKSNSHLAYCIEIIQI